MYFITTKRMLEVCFSAHPNIQYRTCFFCVHFWQISKSSVLDSETKKGCHFFQTAGKTQLPKRLIVGKDRAAGKVLAGKSVHSALLWFVGSKGKTPARSLL